MLTTFQDNAMLFFRPHSPLFPWALVSYVKKECKFENVIITYLQFWRGITRFVSYRLLQVFEILYHGLHVSKFPDFQVFKAETTHGNDMTVSNPQSLSPRHWVG